jgi:hypothetical protein
MPDLYYIVLLMDLIMIRGTPSELHELECSEAR